jgi:hypothetical protein
VRGKRETAVTEITIITAIQDQSAPTAHYIHIENFKLLPHSLGKITADLTKTHIVLLSVEKILHTSEKNVLQS